MNASLVPRPALRVRTAAPPPEPLELPPPWTAPTRPAVPLLASVVPMVGAVALWAVTGSILALWLAALGPLIAGATMLDGARSNRREKRRAERAASIARVQVGRDIDERHADERDRLHARHPDVAGFAGRPAETWRAVPGRAEALVLGAGERPSALRVTGGGDDPASADLRRRATRLASAPVAVPLPSTLAVIGPPVLARAVIRAVVLQLALISPPGVLRVVGPLRGEHAWAETLPHRRATGGLGLALTGPGEGTALDADIVISRARPEDQPPVADVVLTVRTPDDAVLDAGGEVVPVAVEAIGEAQAKRLAAGLVRRAGDEGCGDGRVGGVALAEILRGAPPVVPGCLSAPVGLEAGEPCVIDLVDDGPHAIVAGVTGSGKSELLITWILALSARHPPGEVSFLLADFKGGTAFDALASIPHVTGVITDLDGTGARRAIESLRAEVRWREAALARVGARDIRDPRVRIPRLVIVVDEFAALLGEHPELHAVFTDVAARGRALGMHLILGTQRPAGVIRESLLANCPLRISLRVTDPADSRAVIGTDQAALLPGAAASRGIALVRTAADASPRRVQIALSAPADAAAIAESAATEPPPRRPWLPELPATVLLSELPDPPGGRAEPRFLPFGLADEPERQSQCTVGLAAAERGMLIVGAGGSGKSTALRSLLAGSTDVIRVAGSGEQRWDAVTAVSRATAGVLVVIDDLDTVTGDLPPEYGRELLDRIERLTRRAGETGIRVVAAAQRLTGGAARIAELLPRRLVLGTPSRAEHIAAGGDPAVYAPALPPGRGWLDGRAVQVAVGPDDRVPAAPVPAPWIPEGPLTGVIRRGSFVRPPDAWVAAGVCIVGLDEFIRGEWARAGRVVVAGDPDDWQRQWRWLHTFRADHDLVVDAGCAAEYRLLTGDRDLPPYCEPGAHRAWLLRAGGGPQRVVLPGSG